MGLFSENWEYDPHLSEKLRSLETSIPPRLYKDGKGLYIPLYLKTGFEKTDVVKEIIFQIKGVFDIIA